MRIFVAGATGVIGRRLVPQLVAQGHQVTALTRRPAETAPSPAQGGSSPAEDGPSPAEGGPSPVQGGSSPVEGGSDSSRGGVTWVVGDVYDRERLFELVAAARPEVLMHQLTDLTSRDFAANSRIRREGTRNLVDAALAAGVRRVVSQSIAWAYEPGTTPADESTPLDLHAADEYRRTTVEAVATLEAITAEAPEWVVLRYGMLYGPGTWYAKNGLMATSPLPTGPDVTSFLHIDDAAQAAAAALTWPSGPVNIVDDEPAPASTWSPTFAAAAGTPPPSDAPAPVDAAAGPRPASWARGATNSRARSFGWTPTYPTWRSGFTT